MGMYNIEITALWLHASLTLEGMEGTQVTTHIHCRTFYNHIQ